MTMSSFSQTALRCNLIEQVGLRFVLKLWLAFGVGVPVPVPFGAWAVAASAGHLPGHGQLR